MRRLTQWERRVLADLGDRHPRLTLVLLIAGRLLIEWLEPFLQEERTTEDEPE